MKCNRSRSMAFYPRINSRSWLLLHKIEFSMNAQFGEIFSDLWKRHVRSSDGFSLCRVQRGCFMCFAVDDKGRLVTRSEHGYTKKRRKSWEWGFRERRSIRPLFGEDAIKRDEQAWQESKSARESKCETEKVKRSSCSRKEGKNAGQTERNVMCDRSGDAKFDFKNESRCDIIVSKVRLVALPKWPPSLILLWFFALKI